MPEIRREEWEELLLLLTKGVSILEDLMRPHGFNVGFNLGGAAGGGFEHIHMHVVPRWDGDTNFMPVLAETKVLPEHLDATYDKIVEAMKNKKRQDS
jgi:ATP adenylyltransferase